ncbi:MAG: hypothetical protein M5U18_19685 [Dehalococcoidia bacterium]|nr:hypothetical protein [Dehalococcoidia bacterium]
MYYRLARGVSEVLEHNAAVAAELAERIAACENPAMKEVYGADSVPLTEDSSRMTTTAPSGGSR